MGTGQVRTTTSETAPKSPPASWCSSAVTKAPQDRAASWMAASSRGLMVCRSTTVREMPWAASAWAATRAS